MLLAAILSPQECARSQGSVPLVARLRYFGGHFGRFWAVSSKQSHFSMGI